MVEEGGSWEGLDVGHVRVVQRALFRGDGFDQPPGRPGGQANHPDCHPEITVVKGRKVKREAANPASLFFA